MWCYRYNFFFGHFLAKIKCDLGAVNAIFWTECADDWLGLLTGDSNLIDFLSSSADAIGFTVRSVGNSNGWIPSRNCVTNGIAMCELHWSQGRPVIRVMLKSSGTTNTEKKMVGNLDFNLNGKLVILFDKQREGTQIYNERIHEKTKTNYNFMGQFCFFRAIL